MSRSYVWLVSSNDIELSETVRAAAMLADLDVRGQRGEELPAAVILSLDGDSPRRVRELRKLHDVPGVPILGLSRRIRDLVFEEAFAEGMDDCCEVEVNTIARRLRSVKSFKPEEISRRGEGVIIADRDSQTRELLGYVFQEAGFDVSFTSEPREALRRSLQRDTALVVVSSTMEKEGSDGEPLSVSAPRVGSKAAWIINTPPRQIPAVRARIGIPSETKIAVHDAFTAPTTLLYLANDLLRRPTKDVRASERLLYGTVVWYRLAGQEEVDVGYCYNLSAGGLYVRTLAPRDRLEELWLEFIPPRSDRRVHLEATVMWAQKLGQRRTATAPSGFGVKITGGSERDLRRYQASYDAFLEQRSSLRLSSLPPRSLGQVA